MERYTTKSSEKRAHLFDEILQFYRNLDIPIVFYSKEDPPNYNHFLPFAQQADYIFTSAAEMVPKYQIDCPAATSIDVLPFGINPKHHSPIGSQQADIQRIVPFAGSWFNHKYEERGRWGGDILDAVMASQDYDLLLFDRNSHLKDPRYKFPNRFAHALTPAISHPQLLDIQRLVDVSINLNSVQAQHPCLPTVPSSCRRKDVCVEQLQRRLNSRYPHVHVSNGFTIPAALDSLSKNNSARTRPPVSRGSPDWR